MQKLIDAIEKRHGAIELYGSNPDEENGTCFIIESIQATFSVITLNETLPQEAFNLQVEGIPPGDYLFTKPVSQAELLQLIDQFSQTPSQWP